ncbi:MAG TPA: hypothetical protein VFJ43_02490, partial [Bacteroidia bacterium]|nr:hypothetical protein [Bacteroidia bacterium]
NRADINKPQISAADYAPKESFGLISQIDFRRYKKELYRNVGLFLWVRITDLYGYTDYEKSGSRDKKL